MTNRLKNKTSFLKCIILLFIAGLSGACDEQTVYHSFQSIPQKGWSRKDTLRFDVAIPDSQVCYKLFIELRNRSNYPYQNINLSISYHTPDSSGIKADTLSMGLANQEGIWKGDGWGGLYQSCFFVRDISITKSGHYLFKVIHTLPDNILPGINDVGIKLQHP